jgi:hypothetical protein
VLAGAIGSRAIFVAGSSADLYDAASGEWTTATLPVAFQPVQPHAVAAVGTRLLFVDVSHRDAAGAVAIYDHATDTWEGAHLSAPRAEVAVAVVGGRAVFAGGSLHGRPSAAVDIFDSETGAWSTAALSEPRAAPRSVAVVGTRALFAGGFPSGRVDVYDAAADAWSVDALSLPRAQVAGLALGDRALFAGGWAGPLPRFPSELVDVFEAAGP